MTQDEYLHRLREKPWTFPEAGGAVPPADWVAAAWELKGVREAVVADWLREVSKTGALNCPDDVLRALAQVPHAVSEVYERLLDDSPHREPAFRPQFERVMGAARLPQPLSRLRLVRKLGMEAAELLLAGAFPDPAERVMVLNVMPQLCDLFNEVDPPGFDPVTDDEFDRAVEHVAAGLPGCRSREEVRHLIREGFRMDWGSWAPW
ncbi:MAG TPA: hypothetical protein VGE74_12620, partial [Gemmata sp.]